VTDCVQKPVCLIQNRDGSYRCARYGFLCRTQQAIIHCQCPDGMKFATSHDAAQQAIKDREQSHRSSKRDIAAYKTSVLDLALSRYTGHPDQRAPDDMRQMVETWQLGCGEPAESEIEAYAARLLKKGSSLDARAAVWEIVNAQWKDDPAIRTKKEIAEIIRRWPPKCGRPDAVQKYADYALHRHAWMMHVWDDEPDPKLWTQPTGE
jgi:hypothetical protein